MAPGDKQPHHRSLEQSSQHSLWAQAPRMQETSEVTFRPRGSEARPVLEDAANVVQEEPGHRAPGISVATSCFQLKHGEERNHHPGISFSSAPLSSALPHL